MCKQFVYWSTWSTIWTCAQSAIPMHFKCTEVHQSFNRYIVKLVHEYLFHDSLWLLWIGTIRLSIYVSIGGILRKTKPIYGKCVRLCWFIMHQQKTWQLCHIFIESKSLKSCFTLSNHTRSLHNNLSRLFEDHYKNRIYLWSCWS